MSEYFLVDESGAVERRVTGTLELAELNARGTLRVLEVPGPLDPDLYYVVGDQFHLREEVDVTYSVSGLEVELFGLREGMQVTAPSGEEITLEPGPVVLEVDAPGEYRVAWRGGAEILPGRLEVTVE